MIFVNPLSSLLAVMLLTVTPMLSLSACHAATLQAGGQAKAYVCPPCGCDQHDKTFKEPGACPACQMVLIEATTKDELATLPSFLRVNERVCTGGQPTLAHLEKLKAEGVTAVINLRPQSEHAAAAEEAKAKELGLRYFTIPVVYLQPQPEQATEFLKLTDELKGEHVFIHCAAAIRVGAFWMIRRVLRDGWSYEQALAEANKIGLRDRPHLVEFARKYIEANRK